jgi:hypothetical protein
VAQEKAFTTEEINGAVIKHLSPGKPVKIGGLDGHDGVLAGLRGEGRVTISGKAGSFLAAFLDGPDVTLSGSAGDYAGSTMVSGRLVIEGTVGKGLCCHMAGGMSRVKGRVGPSAGAMMTDGLLVLDSPIGPGPGEGMTGGTLVLLRPNHLPRRLPDPPARVIVPRGTSKDVSGLDELEMDHEEVAALSEALGEAGVNSPEKVADLLVILVPEGESTLVGARIEPRRREGGGEGEAGRKAEAGKENEAGRKGEAGKKGVVLEVSRADEDVDVSQRFSDFTKGLKDREGG